MCNKEIMAAVGMFLNSSDLLADNESVRQSKEENRGGFTKYVCLWEGKGMDSVVNAIARPWHILMEIQHMKCFFS